MGRNGFRRRGAIWGGVDRSLGRVKSGRQSQIPLNGGIAFSLRICFGYIAKGDSALSETAFSKYRFLRRETQKHIPSAARRGSRL